MKRIVLTIALVLVGGLFLTGCTKNYVALTYTKFVETFNKKEGYVVKDMALQNPSFSRYYVAGIENVQFIYYEFETVEKAQEYVKSNFDNRDGYSFKDKGTYMEVTCSDGQYYRLIQVDKMVLIGTSENNSDKGTINDVLGELGY